jgi:hypothetical protein
MSTTPISHLDDDAPLFDDAAFSAELGKIAVYAQRAYETVREAKALWVCFPFRRGSAGTLVATIRPVDGALSKALAHFTPRSFAALVTYSLDSGDDSIFATLRTFLELHTQGYASQAAAMIDERQL